VCSSDLINGVSRTGGELASETRRVVRTGQDIDLAIHLFDDRDGSV